ncbi:BLUF domain-containing protein [Rubrivirga sp. IMCC43871]|uniref:BLUF domain-containing protein n=1 Tax=Rubrivirga sp. IMCC43871 TaxID=3391575 RepID=UPI00398FE789
MSEHDLYALVYISEAASPFSDDELEALLTDSRAYNLGVGVTGFLAYEDATAGRPGTFVQRLEGPRRAVRNVFEDRVLPATRHTDVEVKMEGPIAGRTFSDWTMAFQRRTEHEIEGFDALVERLGPAPE